ncbi:hypothetical protein ACVNAN_004182 [Enterobacter hormaechei]|uniref:hypothetical protein n=1 Tax=Enterobacter TaxID=547 RepID=UPI00044CBA51|nr:MULTISPECIES: hypothetical protein [Enterobacter cloacae complex]AIE65451.1 hypothetical protein ECNIH2_19285 [Enterobacter cloacae ECNIH2]AKK78193.1 hypothetical protein ABY62_16745 [Enterobacter hormaechei]AKK91235.1 hypothetical protein ABY65_07785 [Enterobacter hormaechei]AKK97615.1 hypothetical protein ABY64_17175 [Enterobacter hormaechei]AKL52984.1 hypothetical protein AB285_17010 [Enterobacter hormaechei]
MNNEKTSHSDSDVENAFEALAVDLLSGLLGAHDNEQNAELKDWLDSPFPVKPDVLIRHAQFICERFQAGDDSHLLMRGIDEQLDAMSYSNIDRQKPTRFGAVRAVTTGRDVAKVNALLKVIITWYECEIIRLKVKYGEITPAGKNKTRP